MGRYVNSGRYAYFFLVKVRIGMVIWVGTFIRNFRVGNPSKPIKDSLEVFVSESGISSTVDKSK